MGYPLGKEPVKIGTRPMPEEQDVFQGTSAQDMQRVLWGLYVGDAPLIVRGCEVKGTSRMAYDVKPGVVYIPVGDARGMLVPVDGGTVSTTPAPSSGAREEWVYVDQTGAIKVAAGSLPAGTVGLDRRRVPAGVTATTSAPGIENHGFAMLLGASMGRLGQWTDTLGYRTVVPSWKQTVFAKTFTLATDRLLRFDLRQSMALEKPSNYKGSFVWEIIVDGSVFKSFELEVGEIAETKFVSVTRWMLRGEHTVSVVRRQQRDPNVKCLHYIGSSANWPGNGFELSDVGLAQ